MKYGVLFYLSVIFVYGNSQEEYRDDSSLLFCLRSQVSPLSIDNFSSSSSTGLDELDEFVLNHGVTKISLWIPFAEERDNDGEIFLNRIYKIQFSENRIEEINSLKNILSNLSAVHSAEFVFVRKPYFTPNDPMYNQQWFLPQVGANQAWNRWNPNGGNPPVGNDVLLASVDTGVDWDHVDLRNNLWQNLNEDADGDGHTIEYSGGQWILDPGDLNGIDDDNWDNNENTFIDDLIGWDASGWSGTEDNNPQPRQGANPNGTWAHGTHVAGLLASSTNNGTGIASTSFDSKIMSVKVSTGEQSYPYITHGYSGILYAAKAGYHSGSYAIINNSWGGGGYSNYEQSVINICHDTYSALIFAAAGNGESDGWGEEYASHYPSSYDNVISVTALGTGDNWNHWATYHETVDLSSPGENIRSSVIGNNYSSWDGTSMATPVAASCAGLMRIYYPGITNVQIETMLLASSDPVIYSVNTESYLEGRLGRGRVDIEKALDAGLFPQIEFVDLDIMIIDGEDDEINAGESIELRTILYNNETWGEATNLIAELTVGSNAFILQNEANFGNVLPGEAVLNIEDPFLVQFPQGTIPGEIGFTLNLSSNIDDYMEYSAQLNFSVTVVGGFSEVEILIPYTNGWNLIGLPINESDLNFLDIFPNAIDETLYLFDTNYILTQTLNQGNGYWLRFSDSGSETVVGDPITSLTIDINENWNLISGLSVPTLFNEIIDNENILIPGTLFGFLNSYFQSDYIVPGGGFWVRSISDGEIVLSNAGSSSSKYQSNHVFSQANKLVFKNSLGTIQTLYFGEALDNQDELSFGLPPQPPKGLNVFDVRFVGDFFASRLGGEIGLINSNFPISVESEIVDKSEWTLVFPDQEQRETINKDTHYTIDLNSSHLILLRNNYSDLPEIFDISSFPNPFNSTTHIQFSLHQSSYISLTVFDIQGKQVIELISPNKIYSIGNHSISWNGKNKNNEILSSGVYFLALDAGDKQSFHKLFLLK